MEVETREARGVAKDRKHARVFTYADSEDAYASEMFTGIGLASPETMAKYAEWYEEGAKYGSVARVISARRETMPWARFIPT